MNCPICGEDSLPRYRPFCSRKCADIDLGRWMTGAYVVPGPATEESDDALESGPEDAPGNDHRTDGKGRTHAHLCQTIT